MQGSMWLKQNVGSYLEGTLTEKIFSALFDLKNKQRTKFAKIADLMWSQLKFPEWKSCIPNMQAHLAAAGLADLCQDLQDDPVKFKEAWKLACLYMQGCAGTYH